MKERPIIFSAPMVKAILSGTKTQTRRIVKPQPMADVDRCIYWEGDGWLWMRRCPDTKGTSEAVGRTFDCPYGVPADLLWVKEEHYLFGHWEPVEGVRTKAGRQKWKFVADRDDVLFYAPGSFRKGRHHKDPATPAWHKRLARFMPRRFSRTLLEIVSVRVERLQKISEEDAKAEGAGATQYPPSEIPSFVGHFSYLWETINGPGSWELNPWVWAVEFKRLDKHQ